jgi:hypothetical protein
MLLNKYYQYDKIKENETGGERSSLVRDNKCIQNVCHDTRREETTQKI